MAAGRGENILGILLDKRGDAVLQSNQTNRINRLIKQKCPIVGCGAEKRAAMHEHSAHFCLADTVTGGVSFALAAGCAHKKAAPLFC